MSVPSGLVTQYEAGGTLTVTIDETIYHPGHYRIALAVNDISELPEPPPVTAGATPCGSAPIDAAPEFPVLADGVFEHSAAFGKPQTIDITLPDDITCTNCTLQIIQFMSDHALNDPGGCYYHHCAEIAVNADPGGTSSPGDDTGDSSGGGATTAATSATADGTSAPATSNGNGDGDGSSAGTPTTGTSAASETDPGQVPMEEDGGCSCSLPEGGHGGYLGMFFGLFGLMGLRRWRRS